MASYPTVLPNKIVEADDKEEFDIYAKSVPPVGQRAQAELEQDLDIAKLNEHFAAQPTPAAQYAATNPSDAVQRAVFYMDDAQRGADRDQFNAYVAAQPSPEQVYQSGERAKFDQYVASQPSFAEAMMKSSGARPGDQQPLPGDFAGALKWGFNEYLPKSSEEGVKRGMDDAYTPDPPMSSGMVMWTPGGPIRIDAPPLHPAKPVTPSQDEQERVYRGKEFTAQDAVSNATRLIGKQQEASIPGGPSNFFGLRLGPEDIGRFGNHEIHGTKNILGDFSALPNTGASGSDDISRQIGRVMSSAGGGTGGGGGFGGSQKIEALQKIRGRQQAQEALRLEIESLVKKANEIPEGQEIPTDLRASIMELSNRYLRENESITADFENIKSAGYAFPDVPENLPGSGSNVANDLNAIADVSAKGKQLQALRKQLEQLVALARETPSGQEVPVELRNAIDSLVMRVQRASDDLDDQWETVRPGWKASKEARAGEEAAARPTERPSAQTDLFGNPIADADAPPPQRTTLPEPPNAPDVGIKPNAMPGGEVIRAPSGRPYEGGTAGPHPDLHRAPRNDFGTTGSREQYAPPNDWGSNKPSWQRWLADEVIVSMSDPRPIVSVGDGWRGKTVMQFNLGELIPEGQSLYHDTSTSGARGIIEQLRQGARSADLFAATDTALALGQGGKGVLLELDPRYVNGFAPDSLANQTMKGTGQSAAEYKVNKTLSRSLISITAKTQRQLDAVAKDPWVARTFDVANPERTERGLRIRRIDTTSGLADDAVPVRNAEADARTAATVPPPGAADQPNATDLFGNPLPRAAETGAGDDAMASAAQRVPAQPNPVGQMAIARSPSNVKKVYQVRYRVVSLDDLIPSQGDQLQPNPNFPRQLQPRERTRLASRIQIEKMSQNLEPDVLIDRTGFIDNGPVIIGPDNFVEAGNARTLAMRGARLNYPDNWTNYQNRLRERIGEFGLTDNDLVGIKDPVLVRERVTPMTPAERVAFVNDANASAGLGMSTIENARRDANRLSYETVATMDILEDKSIIETLKADGNADLRRGFIGSLDQNERGQLIDSTGSMTSLGYNRLTAALISKTYRGPAGRELAERLLESGDDDIKGIAQALFSSLPSMARAEALISRGERPRTLSIAEDVAKATTVLARLKKEPMSVDVYLRQGLLFNDELTPFQKELLKYFDSLRSSNRPNKIREFLRSYAEAVEGQAVPAQNMMMFEDLAPPKPPMTKLGGANEVADPEVMQKAHVDFTRVSGHDVESIEKGLDRKGGLDEPPRLDVPDDADGLRDDAWSAEAGRAPDEPSGGVGTAVQNDLTTLGQFTRGDFMTLRNANGSETDGYRYLNADPSNPNRSFVEGPSGVIVVDNTNLSRSSLQEGVRSVDGEGGAINAGRQSRKRTRQPKPESAAAGNSGDVPTGEQAVPGSSGEAGTGATGRGDGTDLRGGSPSGSSGLFRSEVEASAADSRPQPLVDARGNILPGKTPVEEMLDTGERPRQTLIQLVDPRGDLISSVSDEARGAVRTNAGRTMIPSMTARERALMPNLRYVDDDVAATMVRFVQENPDMVAIAQQGRITHAQLIEDLAPRLGMTADDFLKTPIGKTFSTPELLALRAATISKQFELQDLVHDVHLRGGISKLDTAEKAAFTARMLDGARLIAISRGAASTAGRLLNQQRIKLTRAIADAITASNVRIAAERKLEEARVALLRERRESAEARARTIEQNAASAERQGNRADAQRMRDFANKVRRDNVPVPDTLTDQDLDVASRVSVMLEKNRDLKLDDLTEEEQLAIRRVVGYFAESKARTAPENETRTRAPRRKPVEQQSDLDMDGMDDMGDLGEPAERTRRGRSTRRNGSAPSSTDPMDMRSPGRSPSERVDAVDPAELQQVNREWQRFRDRAGLLGQKPNTPVDAAEAARQWKRWEEYLEMIVMSDRRNDIYEARMAGSRAKDMQAEGARFLPFDQADELFGGDKRKTIPESPLALIRKLDKQEREFERMAMAEEAKEAKARLVQSRKLEQVLGRIVGTNMTDDMLENFVKIVETNDPIATAQFLAGLRTATAWERFAILRYASMLSASRTHLKNIVGNTFGVGLQIAARPVAAGFDAAISSVTGRERTRYFGETPRMIEGAAAGVLAGFKDAKVALRTGFSPRMDESSLEHVMPGLQFEKTWLGAQIGRRPSLLFNAFMEMPLRMLLAADLVFRGAARGAETEALIYRAARDKNRVYSPEAFSAIHDLHSTGRDARMMGVDNTDMNMSMRADPKMENVWIERREQYIREHLSEFPDIVQQADKAAARAIYQEKRAGVDAINNVLNLPGLKYPASFIVPFVRTPYNIAAQGAGMTPAAYFMAWRAAANGDSGEAVDRAARATFGTMIMIGAYTAANSGNMTGPMPDTEREKDTLPPGWKPYAWKIKNPINGDTVYVEVKDWGAVAIPLVIGATIGDAVQRGEHTSAPGKLFFKSIGAMGKFMTDLSMLQGIQNVLELMQKPDRIGQKIFQGAMTQMVPYSGLQKQINDALGRPARSPRAWDTGDWTTYFDQLLAISPLTSNLVQERLTPMGDPVQPSQTGLSAFVSPVSYSVERDEPALRLLRRYDVGIPDAPKQALNITLTEDEGREIQKATGRYIRRLTAQAEASQSFQNASIAKKQEWVQGWVDDARQAAVNDFYRKIGTEKYQERLKKEIAQQNQELESKAGR